MIVVTRLNKQEVALNCDLIEIVEAMPDTTIRLVTGKIFVVRESLAEVLERIGTWRSGVLRGAGLEGSLTGTLAPAVLAPVSTDDEDGCEECDECGPSRRKSAYERFLEIPA